MRPIINKLSNISNNYTQLYFLSCTCRNSPKAMNSLIIKTIYRYKIEKSIRLNIPTPLFHIQIYKVE